jgi:energy-coupling factor transporter ATP-binding protein EcfA2
LKIIELEIRNFKGLVHFQLQDLPDLVVLAGPNGSGKSSVLQAITFFKEQIGPYGGYGIRNPLNTGAQSGEIRIKFQLSPKEQLFVKALLRPALRSISNPPVYSSPILEGHIQLIRGGGVRVQKLDGPLAQLLSSYNPSIGIFDYNDANRFFQETDVATLDLIGITPEQEKTRRVSPGAQKFTTLKQFLAQMKLAELQQMQRQKTFDVPSPLEPIRKIFSELLSPKEFIDVDIGASPAKFIVRTPSGDVDIDDLSSGEKEVLFFYADMIRLNPQNSIILIDEPDLHLNQELERRIVPILRNLGSNNQFWIATHSLGIIDTAEPYELFNLENFKGRNQGFRIFDEQSKYDIVHSVAGDVGVVTLGEKIVFCEGAQHNDVAILRTWFDGLRNQVVFVPCGGKSEIMLLSDRILELLKATNRYTQYFAIRDRDFLSDDDLKELESAGEGRLMIWDCYAIENNLLDFDTIAELANEMQLSNNALTSKTVENLFLEVAKEQQSYFGNLLAAHRINSLLKGLRGKLKPTDQALLGLESLLKPMFSPEELIEVQQDSEKQVAEWFIDGSWIRRLPGRILLSKFVNTHLKGITYERFRSLIVNRIKLRGRIPQHVRDIVEKIARPQVKNSVE